MPRETRRIVPRIRCLLGATCLVLPILAAGCADIDPDRREGMWQPEGVVEGNLAAMAADPTDLVQGHGDAGPSASRATAVIQNWTKNGPSLPTQLPTDTTTGGQ